MNKHSIISKMYSIVLQIMIHAKEKIQQVREIGMVSLENKVVREGASEKGDT